MISQVKKSLLLKDKVNYFLSKKAKTSQYYQFK